ncbi:MAG: hypothetical protein M1305_01380 [Candidatus Marsarchaeota archaeon]|nr:hypothetical protein [Candidatus Marsarchaeota archaeon]
MQKVVVTHETESLLLASIFCSELQLVPFQVSALPLASVSMQKLAVGHDIEVGEFEFEPSIVTGELQPVPFQLSTLPSYPTAWQKLVVGQEIEMRSAATIEVPSIFVGELQLVPFHSKAFPLKSTAMQKVDETHDTEVRSFEPSISARKDQVGAEFDTVIENVLVEVCAGELESDTSTVKVELPEALGVPEIEPEDDAKLSPAGSEPE